LGIDPVVRAHFIQIGTPDPQGGDLDTGSDQVRLHHSVCRRSPAGKGGDRVVSGVHGFAVVGGSYGDDLGVIAGAGDGSRFRSAVSGGGYDGDTALPSFFDDPTYRIIPVGTAGRAAEGEGNDSDVVLIAMVDAPFDAGDDIGQISRTGFVQHFDPYQEGLGSGTPVFAVLGVSVAGGASGDMGSVSV